MWEFDGPDPGTWERASLPVSETLYDACDSTNGPCAVGTGGVVLGRVPDERRGSGAGSDDRDPDGWGVVVADGPAARGRTLRAVAATADGERVWFAGESGALGALDLQDGRRYDHSAPDGVGGTLVALCVARDRGEEKLLVADASGTVLPGVVADGDVEWGRPATPADGTTVAGLAADGEVGYAVDGDSGVRSTTADGWERVGIDDAEGGLTSVAADDGRLLAGGADGRVYARDERWVPSSVGEATVRAVARRGDDLLAGGDDGTLAVGRDGDWTAVSVDDDAAVRGVALSDPAVAVGSGGFVLERTGGGGETES